MLRVSRLCGALNDYMKYIGSLVLVFFSVTLFAEEETIKLDNGVEFGFFSSSDYPGGQCGCWYYYPASKQNKGKVVALGEAADEALYIIVDGERLKVSNWVAEYQQELHSISYQSDRCSISIRSSVLSEGEYSSDFNSTITIELDGKHSVIETFGSCGC